MSLKCLYKTRFKPLWLLLASSPLTIGGGCGKMTLGQGTMNDPVPTGTIIAQGPFTGVNGRTVSGNVSIYRQTASASVCNFIVRLQSLNGPSDTSLQVVPVVNGSPVSPQYYTLRSPLGNQNYQFNGGSGACSSSFAQVQLVNPFVQPVSAQPYGIANLTPL